MGALEAINMGDIIEKRFSPSLLALDFKLAHFTCYIKCSTFAMSNDPTVWGAAL